MRLTVNRDQLSLALADGRGPFQLIRIGYGTGGGGAGPQGDSAYQVAVNNGFVGTEVEWLASLEGAQGDSAYQAAVNGGFVGTEVEWIASLGGAQGDSAYQVAVDNGFVGTEVEWIASLEGAQGDSAYQVAVDNGFVGTEAEWLASLGLSAEQIAKVDALPDDPFISLADRNVSLWHAVGNQSTTITAIGNAPLTNVGTLTASSAIAFTNVYTATHLFEVLQTVASTTNTVSSQRASSEWGLSNSDNYGGFKFELVFGMTTGVSNPNKRLYAGLCTSIPSTDRALNTVDGIFLGFDQGDTFFHVYHKATSEASARVATTIPIPTTDRQTMYELRLWADPNSLLVNYSLRDLSNPTVYSTGSFTVSATFLSMLLRAGICAYTGGSNSVIGVAVSHMFVSTKDVR